MTINAHAGFTTINVFITINAYLGFTTINGYIGFTCKQYLTPDLNKPAMQGRGECYDSG